MPDLIILLLILLGIVAIWRGPKVLPEWGAAIGKGIREARSHATKGLDDDKDQPPAQLGEGSGDDLSVTSSATRADTTSAPRS